MGYIAARTQIHGKTVELIMYDGVSELPPVLPSFYHLAKNAKYINWKAKVKDSRLMIFFRNVIESYLSNDRQGVFQNLIFLIERKLAEALYRHPQLITFDPFRVHIRFICDNNASYAGHYLQVISDRQDVYFNFNLSTRFFAHFVAEGEGYIEGKVNHELFHPMETDLNKRYLLPAQKLYAVAKSRHSGAFMGSYMLFETTMLVRLEAVAFFIEQLKRSRNIDFDPKNMRKLLAYFDSMQPLADENVDENTTKSIYYVGAIMAAVIVLKGILVRKMDSSAWITFQRRFIGMKWKFRRDCSAERIGEFFGRKHFRLVFGDADADKTVFEILGSMKSWDHLRFLREYESACSYLGIKEPCFTLAKYKGYKERCWQAHQELLREKEFVK